MGTESLRDSVATALDIVAEKLAPLRGLDRDLSVLAEHPAHLVPGDDPRIVALDDGDRGVSNRQVRAVIGQEQCDQYTHQRKHNRAPDHHDWGIERNQELDHPLVCAKRAFGTSDVTHGTHLSDGRPLLRSQQHETATLGRLYPDLVIGPIDQPTAIIDAKYKPLADPRGVDRADLYQLNAYLASHTSDPLPRGALAYVQFPDQHTVAHAERRGPWRTMRGHSVSFERFPVTEDECVTALRALVTHQR